MKTKSSLFLFGFSLLLFTQVMTVRCVPTARFVLTMRPYLVSMGEALANSAFAVALEKIIDEAWVSLFGGNESGEASVDPYADIVSPTSADGLKGQSRYDLTIEFAATYDQASSIASVEIPRKYLNFEKIRKDGNWMQTFDTKKTIDERTRVGSAQVCLAVLGYKTGRIDGIHGKITSRALSKFQKNSGLTATGNLDDTTYYYLMSLVDIMKKNQF